jgi:hypothetical protein
MMRGAAAILILAAGLAACEPPAGAAGKNAERSGPASAPAIFASADKNITFPTPPGSTYCPLPNDWTGSDHGTTIFLAPPTSCGGAGYPSSSRASGPSSALISVFYGYDTADPEGRAPREPCDSIGEAAVLGRKAQLCETREGGSVMVRADVGYAAEGAEEDLPSEVVFTLATSPDRLERDLTIFKTMLEATTLCTREARGPTNAHLAACPGEALFF